MKSPLGAMVRLFTVCVLGLVLSACGGGGSDGGETPQETQAQTPLSISQSPLALTILQEPVSLEVNGGSGSGAVSFTSSDESVVTVDSSGRVTPVAVGSAEVVVEKAADSRYKKARASVPVEVDRAEQAPLQFAEPERSVYIDSEPFDNELSGGSGEGELRYSTSDPTVVEVDTQTGMVSVVAEGSAQISALKPADDQYREASASYQVQVVKYPQQPMVFAHSVVEAAVTSTAPDNPLTGGSGSGAIVFASSDSDVAEVNAQTGAVSVVGEGTAVITATKAADELYSEAIADYEIEAVEMIGDLSVAVGETDAAISWQSQANTIEMIRSTYYQCDADRYRFCANGRLKRFWHPPETPYLDSLAQLDTLAYLQFQNEDYRSSTVRVEAKMTPFAGMQGHSLVEFNDRLWVIAGVNAGYPRVDYSASIWSSSDGVSWELETDSAAFGARAFQRVEVFNGQLYLFAGEKEHEEDSILLKRDIWRSDNGKDWELVNDFAPFRIGQVIVFKGRLWSVNASAFGDESPEVWSSTDGANWTKEVAIAPFGRRQGFALYTDQETLFLAGGFGEGGSENLLRDVWSSEDGIEWNQVSSEPGFDGLWDATVARIGEEFFLFLGSGPNIFVDRPYYRSADGISWSEVADTGLTQGPASVTQFRGRMLLLGAGSNFIWQSQDGESWRVPVDVSGLSWELR